MPRPLGLDLEELEKLVAEMLGTELDEVSVVDQPATDRPFRLFKRAPGAPRRGAMPGTKEDTGRLGVLLKALSKAVPEGRDRETFDRCVDKIVQRIESGELTPQDPDADPKSVGYAICTASGAGKAAKQDEVPPPAPGEELPPDMPPDAGGDTVEIPASPEAWTFSDCISDAMALGFDQDSSISVCQIIRQDYGDPSDPETILVPDGSSTDNVLADAAVFGGIAKPEGLSESAPEKRLKFSGKNQWLRKFRRFLGVDKPPTRKQIEDARLKKEVRTLMADQAKTKDDLRETIGLLRDVLFASLRAQGIELPPAALAGIVPPAAAVESRDAGGGAAAAIEPDTGADPAKRVKDLEAEVARLRALVETGTKAAPAEGEAEPDASDRMVVPDRRTAPALFSEPEPRVLRKSVDPRGGNGRDKPEDRGHYTTYLNARYPQEDWEAMDPRRAAAR